MKFDSFAEFLAMGGHGPFVWTAYAIAVAVLVGLAVTPLLRKRTLLQQQVMRIKREQSHREHS